MANHDLQAARRELAAKLPALGARVFALQGRPCVTALMKTLGSLLHQLNDFDTRFDHTDLAVCEVLYEELESRVLSAEGSLPR